LASCGTVSLTTITVRREICYRYMNLVTDYSWVLSPLPCKFYDRI